jgi:hypothetical protein
VSAAGLAADAILLLHVTVVAFVLAGEVLILVGAARDWRWIRHRGLRLAHVVLIGFIALQAWLGQRCPLTIWEQALRHRAGQQGYAGGFIEHWLSRVLYIDAPAWAFVAAYSAFALLVLATWRWVPPHRDVQVSRQAGRQ